MSLQPFVVALLVAGAAGSCEMVVLVADHAGYHILGGDWLLGCPRIYQSLFSPG